MPTDKFKRLKQDKKDYILRAASREFAMRDYNEISISKIADEASISRGSFYLYFKDKEDVFCSVIDAHKDRIRNDLLNIYTHATDTSDVIMQVFDYFSHLSSFEQSLFEKISGNMTTNVQELFANSFINFDVEVKKRLRDTVIQMGYKVDESMEERISLTKEILFAMMVTALIDLSVGHQSIEDARQKLSRKLSIIIEGSRYIAQQNATK